MMWRPEYLPKVRGDTAMRLGRIIGRKPQIPAHVPKQGVATIPEGGGKVEALKH